jgi:hypothetical protein
MSGSSTGLIDISLEILSGRDKVWRVVMGLSLERFRVEFGPQKLFFEPDLGKASGDPPGSRKRGESIWILN